MRHYDNGDENSLSWQTLGFLPHAVIYRLLEIFKHVHVLASSFEDAHSYCNARRKLSIESLGKGGVSLYRVGELQLNHI